MYPVKNILLIALALAASVACSGQASAAIVTTNETGVNAIFSQTSFRANPIDVRFGPVVTLVDDDLITIDDGADFGGLFANAPNPVTHINMFFVDEVNWCTSNGSFAGCSQAWVSVFDSTVAASSFGAELNAHEIAHLLGLDHKPASMELGLMNPVLNNDTTLTTGEVATILNSSFVQSDASGFFINVTPVLVQATAVPEPSAFALLGFVTIAMICHRRTRRIPGLSSAT